MWEEQRKKEIEREEKSVVEMKKKTRKQKERERSMRSNDREIGKWKKEKEIRDNENDKKVGENIQKKREFGSAYMKKYFYLMLILKVGKHSPIGKQA